MSIVSGDATVSSSTLPRQRVALVDAHLIFTECLEIALSLRGYECRPVAIPTKETAPGVLLTTVLRARADIVIMNLDLGDGVTGDALIEPIAQSGTPVIIVTESPDRVRWGQSLARGAQAVLSKDDPLSAITAAMRNVSDKVPAMTREDRNELMRAYHQESGQRHDQRLRLTRLTRREREILQHLMVGHQVLDIARLSCVSEATVRTQVKSILLKLEVTSQIAAVGLAHQAAWRCAATAGSSA